MMKNAHAHLLRNVRATDTWAVACLEATAVAGVIMLSALVKIPLPWTPVPVTLQTFPVLVAAYVVGRERAMGGILLYLALGIAGAPLFAVPFGATMGYLLAFAFAPYLTTAFKRPSVGMVAVTAVIYAVGTAWLCLWAGVGLWAGVAMGVLPFIPADAVKVGMACLVASRVQPKSAISI